LRIVTGDEVGQPGVVYTTYAPLARSVVPGRELLLDDGRVVLRVDATDGTEIRTTVVHGSQLGEHKGINAPGVALPASGLTLKDAEDLAFGLSLGVDMVALSFVQSAADVQAARNVTEGHAPGTPIVAKLERPEALQHLDAVLASADAVMVARGDLGPGGPARAGAADAEGDHAQGARARASRDRRDAGAGIDAARAASHPCGSQRRRQCGG
jgi:pyruvate kinase